MFAQVFGECVVGIDGVLVSVEVDVSNGLPAFDIVGLPTLAVKESRERVKAALRNSNISYPMTRITVNLAPADRRKRAQVSTYPLLLVLWSVLVM